jgi:hypothetical protein
MSESSLRVVLDACVIFSAVLRDTLLRAAQAELYQALWSDEILIDFFLLPKKVGFHGGPHNLLFYSRLAPPSETGFFQKTRFVKSPYWRRYCSKNRVSKSYFSSGLTPENNAE